MSGNGVRLVAREGIPVLFGLLSLATISYVSAGIFLALLFVILFALGLYLFRDPRCELPSAPLAVLSPASGVIESINQVEDYRLSRRAQKVRIRMSPWDTHCLRCPTEGKVMKQWSSTENNDEFDCECAYWIQTDEGDDLVLSLGMGKLAVYRKLSIAPGERAGHGQRCGYLYLASVFDIYVPENARLKVEVGEQVNAGTSIIGEYVHQA